jgi:transcription elongation factor GreA
MTGQLNDLALVKRRDIARQIAEARSHGDLGENAEYDAAKEAQSFNEMKIAELQDKIRRCRIINENAIPLNKAVLGTTVWLKDIDAGEELSYVLVSEPEADLAQDKISVASPVGKGLLGHKAGDSVEIKVPAGMLRYKIIKIARTRYG